MAIVFATSGAAEAQTTTGADLSPVVSVSTVNPGDILIAHVFYRDTTTTPSTPSGWTLLFGPADVGTTPVARHWVYGKVGVGGEEGTSISFGTGGGTALRFAICYRYTGRVSGTISQLCPAASFSSVPHATDPMAPTVTTTETGALAVAVGGQSDDNVQEVFAGSSGGTWVLRGAEVFTGGLQAARFLQDCIPTGDPGTVSFGAMTVINDPSGTIGFEIRTQPAVGPAETRLGPVIAPSKAVHRAAVW